MPNYDKQYEATNNSQNQEKVEMALQKKARTEALNATPSPARALASAVLNNPATYRERFTKAVISQQDNLTPNDAQIDTAIGVLWPIFALPFQAL